MSNRLMHAPLGTVLNQIVGNLKSIIIDRVETIELSLEHLIPEGFSNLLLPICVFIYLFIIDWSMALASVITVLIVFIAYGFMMRNFNEKLEKAIHSFKGYTFNCFRNTWILINFGEAVLPSTLLGTLPIVMVLYKQGSLNPAELTMCMILSLRIIGPLTSFTVFIND